jgi:hypothetical protein
MLDLDVPLLRTSERSEWGRCRWAWWQAFVEHIKPATAAPALRFGSLIHESLRVYYRKGSKRGKHPAITFAKLYGEELATQTKLGFRDEDGTWNDAATLGEAMLNGYIDHYGKDDRWIVLATEMPFRVPVLHPRTGRVWFQYAGVVDLVVKDRETKFVGLVDHKTTKNNPTKNEYLALDEQAGAYWRYGRQALYDAGLLRQDRELNGIIFNFLQKKMPDDRERNEFGEALNADGSVSKRQPGPLFHREPVWRNDAEGDRVHERVLEQMREMQLARRGKLAVYKTPGHIMSGMCQMCGFRDMCELHESGADWESLRDATMAEWDPYEEHEIYTGETR